MSSADAVQTELNRFMKGLRKRNPYQSEFQQAVAEVAESVLPYVIEHREYKDACILERLTEPDRIITFRVCWEDDQGNIRTNRAWRVQFSNAIGPYKGGLRFHPSVTVSVLKFLGFEQIFKNSLTGLPMGGAKGGSNFNPKGKSDHEVMRFCHSMMIELHRHIGPATDVPAGDIGVGHREIGYLFGQYNRLVNHEAGVLTGKGLSYGGSLIRKEATGYGCVYMAENVLQHHGGEIEGKTALVSGSGNVAIYCAERAMQLGAKVVTMSDSDGTVYDSEGLNTEKLQYIKYLKEVKRGRISEYVDKFKSATYKDDARPWDIDADIAFPCATQNEIEEADAKALVKHKVKLVCEGANMPCTLEAVHVFEEAGTLYVPGKAANAGGVSVSGLEQSQNAQRLNWSRDEVDAKLRSIMTAIHGRCVEFGNHHGQVDYVKGANVAGFKKVADAMLAYGIV